MEITKREIIGSVSIIAILLLIGVMISNAISNYQLDQNEICNKALKIEKRELFEYGMRTNVGNAFVYGDLRAVDTVTYPEIGGEYMYVKKIKEEYTMHTRQVAHTRTVNGKTQTYYTTETYWTWDEVWRESLKCKEISFLGTTFGVDKIDIPGSSYIKTINKSSHTRYKYYGTDIKHTGTIFTELKDSTISDHTKFYRNKTIDETVKHLESGSGLVAFWIFWILLICAGVYGFYYLDNHWLE